MRQERKKIIVVVGTRPEGIKMAPVIHGLLAADWASVLVVSTAQHREMLDSVFRFFGITPDIDLNVMTENQSLSSVTARIVESVDKILVDEKPDAVLAQGDTTTVFATALACFYRQVNFGHVEAGLRTHDFANPFPEEMNRVFVSALAKWNFAPTAGSADNLRAEGAKDGSVFITGNTVIDALFDAVRREPTLDLDVSSFQRTVLVTCHRRENFGQPLRNICNAILQLAERFPETGFLFPVHHNPNVRGVIYEMLENTQNIILTEPLDYPEFVSAMSSSFLIITDSGGVQEEAPALGKPVLVTRIGTERPEAVLDGPVQLVGTSTAKIVDVASELLKDDDHYRALAKPAFPYGDGTAATKILSTLQKQLSDV